MRTKLILLATILVTTYCAAQNNLPIINMNPAELDKVKLVVFVGEKISIEKIKSEKPSFDNIFKAKYKVIEQLYGRLANDTIEFLVADHYGIPHFSYSKNVLLYISQDKNGNWYHQKYLYTAVYETTNGRWAAPGKDGEYNHVYNSNPPFQPEKILFKEDLCQDISELSKEDIKFYYEEPYYKIENKKACPIMGNYIEELFELQKAGVLHARGIFK